MNRIISVTIKDVYGNRLFYPANTAAVIAAALVQAKTLTTYDLGRLMALGFDIVIDGAADARERAISEVVAIRSTYPAPDVITLGDLRRAEAESLNADLMTPGAV
jgi:hypothetical protein